MAAFSRVHQPPTESAIACRLAFFDSPSRGEWYVNFAIISTTLKYDTKQFYVTTMLTIFVSDVYHALLEGMAIALRICSNFIRVR